MTGVDLGPTSLTGELDERAPTPFFCFNDDGEIVALRCGNRTVVSASSHDRRVRDRGERAQAAPRAQAVRPAPRSLCLPTEAEWEFAVRGGPSDDALRAEPFDPVSGWKVNIWQGAFAATDLAADCHHGAAPVARFALNGCGLLDMLGNVSEHVSDWWVPAHPEKAETDPESLSEALAAGFSHPEMGARRVVKGGSWLYVPTYCLRYRPTVRQPGGRRLGSHRIGFRIAMDAD